MTNITIPQQDTARVVKGEPVFFTQDGPITRFVSKDAHDARVAELEAERDAAIAEAHACGAERAVWKARAEAAEAAIQAAVVRVLETSALKCKAKAAITRKKAKTHTAQGKDISAAIFVGAYISARGLAATIRAIASDPAQVERIARGAAE